MASDNSSYLGGTINMTSTKLNGQAGCGTQKPPMSGSADPGGTKPSKYPDAPVPMPK